ncbi:MAG: hypothetical protein AAF502_18525 [Bacteroidota bacterium]
MKFLKTILTLFSIILFVSSMSAQDQKKQLPCSAPEYRAFDFWIGDWEVFTPDGKLVGTNHVKQLYNSCVINENWIGAGGSEGESYNTYDPRTGTWSQVWVDNGGNTLHFEGHAAENAMLLRGESVDKDGNPLFFKLSFYHNPEEDTVRQVWESSKNEGKWQTIFEGIYKKKKADQDDSSGK